MIFIRQAPLAVASLLFCTTSLAAQRPDSVRIDTLPHARTLPTLESVARITPVAGPGVGSGVPARVQVLGPDEFRAFQPRILPNALHTVAGFSAYDDLGSPYKLNLSTRGFVASPVVGVPQGVAVFLDGVRMNEPEASQVNFDLLPMDAVERIEVLSGNGSLLGRNALGGAINLVTARGTGPTSGALEMSAGSFGAARGEGHIAGRAQDGVDWYLGGDYNREGGWREATGDAGYQGFVNLGKTGARGGVRLQAFYSRDSAATAGSLPESVIGVRPDSNLSAGDYENLWAAQGALQAYRQMGTGRLAATFYVRRHRAARFNANQFDDPDAFGISYNTSVGLTTDYRWVVALDAVTLLSLRAGVDAEAARVSIDIFADSTKFGVGRTQTTEARSSLWDVAPFAAADLTLGRFTLSAGARFDVVRIPFHNVLNPAGDTVASYDRFNPRLGVAVDAGRGVVVFASWGQAFRAPAVIENACADPQAPCPLPFALGDDPPLQPVKATTIEAGIRYQSGAFSLNGSAYRTDVTNDIFLTPFGAEEPTGSTIDGYFINLPRTRHAGIEASITYAPRAGNSLYVNYARTRATFESGAVLLSSRAAGPADADPVNNPFPTSNVVIAGDRFPLVPNQQLQFGGAARLGPVTVGANGRYMGTQFLRGDEANVTAPLPGYFVADGRVSVTVAKRWEIIGVLTNVLQNRSAVFGTYNVNEGNPGGRTVERFLTPGAPRTFRVSIRTELGHLFAARD